MTINHLKLELLLKHPEPSLAFEYFRILGGDGGARNRKDKSVKFKGEKRKNCWPMLGSHFSSKNNKGFPIPEGI
jgi:hypothetical protein